MNDMILFSFAASPVVFTTRVNRGGSIEGNMNRLGARKACGESCMAGMKQT